MSTTLIYPTVCDDAVEVTTVVVSVVIRDSNGNFVKDEFGEIDSDIIRISVPLENAEMRQCRESLRLQIEYLNLIPSNWIIQDLDLVDPELTSDSEF